MSAKLTCHESKANYLGLRVTTRLIQVQLGFYEVAASNPIRTRVFPQVKGL